MTLFGKHGRPDGDGIHVRTAAPVDVDALRQAGTPISEIDSLTFCTRVLQLKSMDLARRFSSPKLRSISLENAETLRCNVDQLLDLRLEVAADG